MPESSSEAAAFWQFSLEFYGRPEVRRICLALQDEHGLDVNLLLLCCWHALAGRGALSHEDLAAAEAAVADWRERIVAGLRAVRRALDDGGPATAGELRAEVLRLEIAAERDAQALILSAVPRHAAAAAAPFEDAQASLAAYLGMKRRAAALALPLLGVLRAQL